MDKEQKLHHKISELAYKFYVLRKYKTGHALEDWLEAEKILKNNNALLSKVWSEIYKFLVVFIKWILPISIPAIVLILQFSPLLTISDISGGLSSTGKIYFYIKNVGSIPAYNIKGRFVITSNKESKNQQTSDERIISTNIMDTGDSVIFYPTDSLGMATPLVYSVDIKKFIGDDFKFLSVYFYYSQFNLFPFWSKLKYEGVFQYENGKWVLSSQTIYPNFFACIFKNLRKEKIPEFIGYKLN